MHVSDILESKGDRVVEVETGTQVRDVARRLREEQIGAVLVRNQDGTLAGIVSERDIVRNLADEGPEGLGKSAGDLMSRDVISCRPDSSIEELMEQMLSEQIRHLPVYEGDRLMGIISINDVVKGMLSEMKWREKALRQQVVTAVGWSTDDD